jgi:hypothetical protein
LKEAADLQLEIRAGTHLRAAGYLGGLLNARPDKIHLAVCNLEILQNRKKHAFQGVSIMVFKKLLPLQKARAGIED